MAQKSLPWPRGVAADSLVGYTAQEWAGAWAEMQNAGGVIKIAPNLRTDATLKDIGVFYSVANRLVVTVAASRVNVDTGSALVCGHAFYNDTIIGAAVDITSPVANPRIDRVIVRCNFAAADYVPASASAALFTVPSYTARVTVIHGAENAVPVAPVLTQDQTLATYWDIPLYQYQVSVAGALTALTDEREWADAEIKYLFVTPMSVFDDTGIAACSLIQQGYVLPDATVCSMYGTAVIPADFIAGTDLTVQIHFVVLPATAGNIEISGDLDWSSCGNWFDLHSDSVNGPVTVTSDAAHYLINCLLTKTIAPSPLDQLFLYYVRNAQSPFDTLDDSVCVRGWLLSYLGWR